MPSKRFGSQPSPRAKASVSAPFAQPLQGSVDGRARIPRHLRRHGRARPGGNGGPPQCLRHSAGRAVGGGGGSTWLILRALESRGRGSDGGRAGRSRDHERPSLAGGRVARSVSSRTAASCLKLLQGGAAAAERTIDAGGRLCVAGFLEPHIHLDKAQINDDVRPNRFRHPRRGHQDHLGAEARLHRGGDRGASGAHHPRGRRLPG